MFREMARIRKYRHATRLWLDALTVINWNVNACADAQKAGTLATMRKAIAIRFHSSK